MRHEFIDGELVAMAKVDEDYRFIPSLRDYVLVAQDDAVIEVRSRGDGGNWTTRTYREGQEAAIGAVIDIAALYRKAKKNARR